MYVYYLTFESGGRGLFSICKTGYVKGQALENYSGRLPSLLYHRTSQNMGTYVNYLIFRFGDTPYYPQSCSYRIEAFRKEMPQHAALHKNATTHKSINSGDREWNSKHEASQSHS